MTPNQYLDGLTKYLSGCPAEELLWRTVRYGKAVFGHDEPLPRIIFREQHEDAYPPEFLIIKLGPIGTGEVRLAYRGFYAELRQAKSHG